MGVFDALDPNEQDLVLDGQEQRRAKLAADLDRYDSGEQRPLYQRTRAATALAGSAPSPEGITGMWRPTLSDALNRVDLPEADATNVDGARIIEVIERTYEIGRHRIPLAFLTSFSDNDLTAMTADDIDFSAERVAEYVYAQDAARRDQDFVDAEVARDRLAFDRRTHGASSPFNLFNIFKAPGKLVGGGQDLDDIEVFNATEAENAAWRVLNNRTDKAFDEEFAKWRGLGKMN